jgi:hypothetical protein
LRPYLNAGSLKKLRIYNFEKLAQGLLKNFLRVRV